MLSIDAQFPPKMKPIFARYVYRGTPYYSEEQFRAEHGGDLAPMGDLKHARFKVFYGGRSAGRSWSVCRAALLIGMGGGPAGQLPEGLRVLCGREIQNSLADSIKKELSDQIGKLGLDGYYEILDATIRGRKGTTAAGTEFLFEGLRRNTNKIKSFAGIDLFIGEEAQPISMASWKDLIPTIRKVSPGGPLGMGAEFWINFNPELETDETYQRFVVQPPENAIVIKTNWRDNPWLPPSMVEDMKADRARSEDLYLHVWEGECRYNLEGSVYADELREVQEQGRVGEHEYSRGCPVSVYFDLGHADYTSIWFVQRIGWEFAVIDFYQNNRKHIDHYLEVMQSRGYIYDVVWLPHDAARSDIGSKMTVMEQIEAKGYSGRVRRVPKLTVEDGIQAVRTVFPSCQFDRARTAEGMKMLRNYTYAIDPVTKQLGSKPLHNWASHAADAFRYFAVASRMNTAEANIELPPLDGRLSTTMKKLGNFFPAGQNGWLR